MQMSGRQCAHSFFCGVLSAGVCMQNLFFWVCMQSPVASCLRAQIFFVLSSQQQGCACRNFFYLFCPVTSSLLGARSFLDAPAQPARHACVSGAPIFLSCPVASSSCAHIFFTAPHYCLVTSRCVTRAARKHFFVTSVQQCEGYRARRTFLLRSSFSFPVRSHLRRHLVLFFFMKSLQYTFSESCVRNLNFFGIFPLLFLVLWPHWSEPAELAHGGG
jgi:hypothetical protein